MDSEAVYSVRVGSCITNLHLETLKEEEEEEEEPVLSFFHSLPQWNFFSSSFFFFFLPPHLKQESNRIFSLVAASESLLSLSSNLLRLMATTGPPPTARLNNKQVEKNQKKMEMGGMHVCFVLFFFKTLLKYLFFLFFKIRPSSLSCLNNNDPITSLWREFIAEVAPSNSGHHQLSRKRIKQKNPQFFRRDRNSSCFLVYFFKDLIFFCRVKVVFILYLMLCKRMGRVCILA